MLYHSNLLRPNTELVGEERGSTQYCDHALRFLYSSVNDSKKAGVLTLEQTPLNRNQQLPAPHKRLSDGLKRN